MTDPLALFRAFVRVVEAGSFTRVAQEQNSSQPTVSRQVAALEEHLGTRLFTRTTRKLTLTDDGRGFYERAKLAIEAVRTRWGDGARGHPGRCGSQCRWGSAARGGSRILRDF